MPYRTTINTDNYRMSFLENCLLQHQNDVAAGNPVLSSATAAAIENVLPQFRDVVTARGREAATQINAVAAKEDHKAVVAMWISHFFQCLCMWIKRELHDWGLLKYYGITNADKPVPELKKDDDVIYWGRRLLDGEALRVADGTPAMLNPSAEAFRPIFEEFLVQVQCIQKEKLEFDIAEEAVAALRPAVDAAIRDALAELDFRFRKEDAASRRRKLRLYGVKYSYRKNESREPDELPDPSADQQK